MRRIRRFRRRRSLSVNLLLPNIVTTLALCAGLTAIRFAIQEHWELAVIAILVAAVLDGLDGRVARLLRASSSFGAQLDSLSDVISFGVAPAVVIYLWCTQSLGNVGWIPSLALAVCCALRLARFNSQLEIPDRPAWTKLFFTGVPAPAGGALALAPMIATFAVPGASVVMANPVLVAVWTMAMAYLMVSSIPTFSMKGGRIPQRALVPLLLGVGLVAALLLTTPWFTLLAMVAIYLGLIPLSLRKAHALRRRDRADADGLEAADAAPTAETPVPPGGGLAGDSPSVGGPLGGGDVESGSQEDHPAEPGDRVTFLTPEGRRDSGP